MASLLIKELVAVQAMREYYLQTMGITVWRERQAELSCWQCEVGGLLIVAVQDSSNTAAQQALLAAIIQAIGLSQPEIVALAYPSIAATSQLVIAFGERLAGYSQQARQALVLPDLTMLLSSPEAKRDVWQQLCAQQSYIQAAYG